MTQKKLHLNSNKSEPSTKQKETIKEQPEIAMDLGKPIGRQYQTDVLQSDIASSAEQTGIGIKSFGVLGKSEPNEISNVSVSKDGSHSDGDHTIASHREGSSKVVAKDYPMTKTDLRVMVRL